MNQYTITEENDWEGETFSYVMDLTDEEFNYINDRIGSIDALSIEPTTHTKESVKIINDHSGELLLSNIKVSGLKITISLPKIYD